MNADTAKMRRNTRKKQVKIKVPKAAIVRKIEAKAKQVVVQAKQSTSANPRIHIKMHKRRISDVIEPKTAEVAADGQRVDAAHNDGQRAELEQELDAKPLDDVPDKQASLGSKLSFQQLREQFIKKRQKRDSINSSSSTSNQTAPNEDRKRKAGRLLGPKKKRSLIKMSDRVHSKSEVRKQDGSSTQRDEEGQKMKVGNKRASVTGPNQLQKEKDVGKIDSLAKEPGKKCNHYEVTNQGTLINIARQLQKRSELLIQKNPKDKSIDITEGNELAQKSSQLRTTSTCSTTTNTAKSIDIHNNTTILPDTSSQLQKQHIEARKEAGAATIKHTTIADKSIPLQQQDDGVIKEANVALNKSVVEKHNHTAIADKPRPKVNEVAQKSSQLRTTSTVSTTTNTANSWSM